MLITPQWTLDPASPKAGNPEDPTIHAKDVPPQQAADAQTSAEEP